jgi:ribonuclease G
MAKEICISSTPHETRLAILEDDQLAEIYYERENEYTLAGSIYNGRVTRVLPGMQSAFVDIGLERDAFLYVTDFLELEDPEETDELEEAAVSGGGQQIREVRSSRPERPERSERPERQDRPERAERSERPERQDRPQRTEPEQKPRQEQPRRERRFPAELPPEVVEEEMEAPVAVPAVPAAPAAEAAQDDEDAGARRWRGRRRRRGSRGAVNAPEPTAETETVEAATHLPEFVAAGAAVAAASALVIEEVQEAEAAPLQAPAPKAAPRTAPVESTPFVLPGESLRKYGGAPAETASPEDAPASPAKPAITCRPSTLIEVPLEWDGNGLLPGESLARHRRNEPEAAEEAALTSDEAGSSPAEVVEFAAEAPAEPFVEALPEAAAAEEFVEEEWVEEELAHTTTAQEDDSVEPEPGAAASHNIDPTAPQGFRLFGFGGKKKEGDGSRPAHVEEDFIEEEAFAAPKPAARPKAAEDAPRPQRPQQARPEGKRILVDFDDSEDFGEETSSQPAGEAPEYNARRDRSGRTRRGRNDRPERGERQERPERSERSDRSDRPERSERPARSERGDREERPGQPAERPSAAVLQRRSSRRSMQTTDLPVISDLLKPGQEILVQIAKEPIAKKGARITSHIALPGRFLVFMPTVTHIGVSRKIASDEERQRLKRILVSERGDAQGGFIVRTAAEGASEEELRADLRFLLHLWSEIKLRSDGSKSPALIYHDLSLIERILRDQVSSNFSNIWVDSEADYERIVRFLNRFSPTLVRRVKLYTKETPLFEHFGIEDEISKALRSKVWLKSGGSIVINQTEALVAIDINTGKYVGKSARLEDTILKTNLDAVPEIVRQIRLRDLGGIIVIDFIDMDERKNRFKVMAALEEALKTDKAPTKVLQFNDFGLVAITRKRVKQSLERTLSVPCPTCQATGMVKSPVTVCNEIYIEMRKMKKYFENEDVTLRVHPETLKVLKANNGAWLTEFEELIGKNILPKSDPALHPEQFDIQG